MNSFNNTDLATIKKPSETEIITKEEFNWRVNELKKCKEDIIYFAKKYFRIVSLKDGLIIINPYPKQEELINFFTKNKRSIVLSSRQSGKCVSFWTWITVRHKKFTKIHIKIPIGIFYLLNKLGQKI